MDINGNDIQERTYETDELGNIKSEKFFGYYDGTERENVYTYDENNNLTSIKHFWDGELGTETFFEYKAFPIEE